MYTLFITKSSSTPENAADAVVTLHEAADRLGVHYMTAYRYVRTGRLPAYNHGNRWEVRVADLEQFRTASEPQASRRGRPDWDMTRGRLLPTLLRGDEAGAWSLVETALGGGADPDEVHLRLLAPTLREIGEQWASGTIDIADEHRASVVATRVVARLGPQFWQPGRRVGKVVVAGVEGDHHSLPVAMLADLLRSRGLGVVDLGPDTPIASLTGTLGETGGVVAVCVSVSIHERFAAVRRTTRTLRNQFPDKAVYVGGPAVTDSETAHRLGSDAYASDGAELAAMIRRQVHQ